MKWRREEKAEPITRDRLDQYKKERSDLEVDLLDEVLSSRKNAWRVAAGGGFLAVLSLALAGFVIHRYSQPIPEHILAWNKDTGAVQELSLVTQAKTYGEVTDSYWVGQFVQHFEGYNFSIAQADYNAVGLMAEPEVAEQYQARYHWGRPDAIDKRVGSSESVRVHVSSVILDRQNGIATVRFTTTKQYAQRPLPEPTQYWIVTMAYSYKPGLMTAEQRQVNPLGFRVRTYRVNAEAPGVVGG